MSGGVNLLPSSAKFQAAKTKYKRYVYYFSVIFVTLYVVTTLVVLGINMMADSKLKNGQKKYQQALSQYESLNDNVVTTQKLKYQAKMVSKALNERFEYGSAFKRIGGLFSDLQVNVLNYQLDKGNIFKLSGLTNSNDNMDGVEKKIIDINQGLIEGIKSARLSNLSVTNNLWKFDVEVATK